MSISLGPIEHHFVVLMRVKSYATCSSQALCDKQLAIISEVSETHDISCYQMYLIRQDPPARTAATDQ